VNKSSLILSFSSVCLAFVVVFLGFKMGFSPTKEKTAQLSWTHEDQRSLANKLKGAGLALQAVREYEQYIKIAPIDKKQLANLSYTLGKMHMEAGQYEEALSWFYRVEIADPETTLKADVGSKIINCLERTGKYHAAEYALSKRASHEKESGKKGSKVAAEIAGEKIYLEDINDALDSMPEWIRKQFEGKEKKTEFLKKYVADELFYRKAIKLEYDKDPEVRRKLANIEKELLVNKVVEEELKDKIKIEEDDLRNFFEAHKQDYLRKKAVKVSLIKAGMKEIADKITENLKSGKDFNQLAREISLDKGTAENGGKFSGWVRKGEDDLGIGNTEEVSRVLFATKKGEITLPVEAGGYYYIFRVDEKRPEKMPAFKESRERVKNDYYMQKLKISYQNLLDQILKSSEVKLYPEAFTGEGPS
jgi:parvulin-like peptidyl-prolyl isomerase